MGFIGRHFVNVTVFYFIVVTFFKVQSKLGTEVFKNGREQIGLKYLNKKLIALLKKY